MMDWKGIVFVALCVTALVGLGGSQTEVVDGNGNLVNGVRNGADTDVVLDMNNVDLSVTTTPENIPEATAISSTAEDKNPTLSVTESSSIVGVVEVNATTTSTKPNVVDNIEKAMDKIETILKRDFRTTTRRPEDTTRAQEKTSTTRKVAATTTAETETKAPEQTYKEAEKEIADFVNSILRSLLPQIVGGSGGAKLSSRCTGGMMKVFGHIRRMKGWTLKMLDSMGKPSPGILHGTAYSMGDYDQCLDLSVTNKGEETTNPAEEMFRGKYCRVRIQFPQVVVDTATMYQKGLVNATVLGRLRDTIEAIPYIPVKSNYMSHFLGLCFPSTCTDEDLKQLVKLIPFPGKTTLDKCEVKTKAGVDNTQLTIMCLFLILILFVIVSTFTDWILHSKPKEKSLPPRKDKRCVSVSVSFSLCNNSKKLFKNIGDDVESLMAGQAVRGILVTSVAWIVLGHTYLFPKREYYFQMSSLDNLRKYWNESYFTAIASYPLAFESLFVCFGFLLTYSLWQPALKSRDVKINVIRLLIKDYIRLYLPVVLLFGVVWLLPLVGSGPFWGDLLQGSRDICGADADAIFGMHSNFMELEDQCFPHLWFVSCLGQLTFVGIFLSWLLSRNMKMGVLTSFLLCVACNVTVGVITFKSNLPPSYLAYFAEQSSSWFWKINMSLPMVHFGSYVLGMFAGILAARKDYHRCRMPLVVLGWLACFGVLYVVLWSLYVSRDGSLSPHWSAVLAGLHKTAFALCVAWVVVACSYGVGGFVNSIFSCRIFDPLFKLSYYAYIFHYVIISFVVSVAREHTSYNHLELILRTSSYLAITYFISYLLYMVLEMPLKSLKTAFCPKKTCQLDVTTLNNFPMQNMELNTKNTEEGSLKLWSITESENGILH